VQPRTEHCFVSDGSLLVDEVVPGDLGIDKGG
jgi:hypothetical protein